MMELRVCIGTSCHLRGSYNVIQTFQHLIEEKALHDKIDLKAAFCMNACQAIGVSLSFNGEKYFIRAEDAREFFNSTILPALA